MAKAKSKSTPKAPATTKKPDPTARAAILAVGAVALEIRHLQDLIQQVGIAISLLGADDAAIELVATWADRIGRHIEVVLEYFIAHPVQA
jgi:hypothetical protein